MNEVPLNRNQEAEQAVYQGAQNALEQPAADVLMGDGTSGYAESAMDIDGRPRVDAVEGGTKRKATEDPVESSNKKVKIGGFFDALWLDH
jgi:hypothetical protein